MIASAALARPSPAFPKSANKRNFFGDGKSAANGNGADIVMNSIRGGLLDVRNDARHLTQNVLSERP